MQNKRRTKNTTRCKVRWKKKSKGNGFFFLIQKNMCAYSSAAETPIFLNFNMPKQTYPFFYGDGVYGKETEVKRYSSHF
jgi:hypothetical protein